MTEQTMRELPVQDRRVQCTDTEKVTLDRCRFCVHSRAFLEKNAWVTSPARAYCMRERATNEVDLTRVTAVRCDDQSGEGYRSMMNIIG